ncbi:UNKNOWN [Stylonychia lemnae]|uniref:Uncharacterized protein n=1 Tax=Stylonychia lemnae TaxID=5949 RepID=A0A077ZZA5_STYLE|nr:UNKNOWN [Stylonychia lemnae]|eukprot:CDW74553.1 UNKNOWN [Stylonychia lemnae]
MTRERQLLDDTNLDDLLGKKNAKQKEDILNKPLEAIQQQLSYYIFTSKTSELKSFNTLNVLDDEIQHQVVEYSKKPDSQNFDLVDFQKEAFKRAEEQRRKQEEERTNAFKNKVFGGIMSKFQQSKDEKKTNKKQMTLDELDFETLSLKEIAQLPNDNKVLEQEKAKLKKTTRRVINPEDIELLQLLFADELISTQHLHYTKEQQNMENSIDEQEGESDESQSKVKQKEDKLNKNVDLEQLENLSDIHMDLGGLTREIAPLKHKKIDDKKISDKIYVNLHSTDDEENLVGYHFFHHIIGLSNLKKLMKDKIDELNISNFNTVVQDDTSALEDSVLMNQKDDSIEQLSKNFDFENQNKDQAKKQAYQEYKQQQAAKRLRLNKRNDYSNEDDDGSQSDEYGEEKNDEIYPLKGQDKQANLRKSVTAKSDNSKQSSNKGNENLQYQREISDPLTDESPNKKQQKQNNQVKGPMNDFFNQKFQARRHEMDQFLSKRMNNNPEQQKSQPNSQTRPVKSGQQSMQQQLQQQLQNNVRQGQVLSQSDRTGGAGASNYNSRERGTSGSLDNNQIQNTDGIKQQAGQQSEFVQLVMDQSKLEDIRLFKSQDPEYMYKIEKLLENIEQIREIRESQKNQQKPKLMLEVLKRLEILINQLYQLIKNNENKLIPLQFIARSFMVQNDDFNEILKAKILPLLIREYQKNREQNKQKQAKKPGFGASNEPSQSYGNGQYSQNMGVSQKNISQFNSKEGSQKQLQQVPKQVPNKIQQNMKSYFQQQSIKHLSQVNKTRNPDQQQQQQFLKSKKSMESAPYIDYKQTSGKNTGGPGSKAYLTNSTNNNKTKSNKSPVKSQKNKKRDDSQETWIGSKNDSSDEIYYDNSTNNLAIK